MPIEISTPIQVFDQEQFHALDRKIMGIVFEIHNEFGRLMDEVLYKSEIAAHCAARGLQPVEREVRIRVRYQSFVKDYVMDLLVGHGFMLEAKTVERLVAAHRSQSLNYLLLTGMKHGRLVNLRTHRVQHEFISTTLTVEQRRQFTLNDQDWVDVNAASRQLKEQTVALLEEWGAFLDVNLYREALVHFLGGAAAVCRPVEILSGSQRIGTQNFNLLSEDIVFVLTTRQENVGVMRDHLDRLLRHTHLKHLQWINLNRHEAEFTTLSRTRR